MARMTNRETCKTSFFESLCEKAGVKPTKRQASKFHNGKGRAYAESQTKTNKSSGEAAGAEKE